MTLNMKNYKGYDKLPYCNAHYPTTKHTAVADTPEARRIAENTKIQSQVQYHADFERQKGHKTSVVDDPETSRIKHNTQIQSNVNYWGLKEQKDQMEGRRPNETADDVARRSRNPGKISDYDPAVEVVDSPYTQRNSANVVYDSQRGEEQRSPSHPNRSSGHGYGGGYAPFSYGGGGGGGGMQHQAPPPSHTQSTGQYRSSYGESQQAPYSYNMPASPRSSMTGGGSGYSPQRDSGYNPQRDSGYNPQRDSSSYGNNRYSGSVDAGGGYGYSTEPQGYGGDGGGNRGSYHDATQPGRSQPPPKQVVYKAMYDYTAADSDEVSFMDGDHIVHIEVIDAGWMTGTVQRTGQHGMLPSNYVERIN